MCVCAHLQGSVRVAQVVTRAMILCFAAGAAVAAACHGQAMCFCVSPAAAGVLGVLACLWSQVAVAAVEARVCAQCRAMAVVAGVLMRLGWRLTLTWHVLQTVAVAMAAVALRTVRAAALLRALLDAGRALLGYPPQKLMLLLKELGRVTSRTVWPLWCVPWRTHSAPCATALSAVPSLSQHPGALHSWLRAVPLLRLQADALSAPGSLAERGLRTPAANGRVCAHVVHLQLS